MLNNRHMKNDSQYLKHTKRVMALAMTITLAGCSSAVAAENVTTTAAVATETAQIATSGTGEASADTADDVVLQAASETAEAESEIVRDLVVESGSSITITEAGTYRLSGQATEATIVVDAADTDKVTLELCGLTIENSSFPAIYVRSADKVHVTLIEGTENALSVTGTFIADGDTATDAVIFSKDDLVLDGEGSLTITSSEHGIVSKDDLKVKDGTYTIATTAKALSANDTLTIETGTVDASASEGLEATVVSVEGGTVHIQASDDGINATTKSDKEDIGTPTISVSGGELTVEMAQGDTDALDANGNIYVSGGTVTISAQFAFDFDGEAAITGGTVYVNGSQVTTIENSMMGGGRGMGGAMGGMDAGMGHGFRG